MNLSRIACARFARLSEEAGDRALRGFEQRFVDRHREQCPECRSQETETCMALNMLRGIAVTEDDITVSAGFEERIVRQAKVSLVRDGLRYWIPAAYGALAATCALFAAMHVAATPGKMQEANVPGGQARNTVQRLYPNLELERIPEFKR